MTGNDESWIFQYSPETKLQIYLYTVYLTTTNYLRSPL